MKPADNTREIMYTTINGMPIRIAPNKNIKVDPEKMKAEEEFWAKSEDEQIEITIANLRRLREHRAVLRDCAKEKNNE